MERVMADVAIDLKERFFNAELWFLEKWEMYGVNPDGKSIPDVLTDEENKAVDILKRLYGSVDAVPPELLNTMEELRNSTPELSERWLAHGVQVVGFGFFPTSATEFVMALNRTVQSEACA
jgi:hypothetical protein